MINMDVAPEVCSGGQQHGRGQGGWNHVSWLLKILFLHFQPYSYRDEHSSPFGWKTRSQQNLHFDIYNDPGVPGPGMDAVTARRSAILSCPFGQYYSKIPKFAKPVSIPIVPSLASKTEDLAEVTSLVSSVVIESENNIVLDFSNKSEEGEPDDSGCNTPVTLRSDTSSTSLLSKVIKVTMSSVYV